MIDSRDRGMGEHPNAQQLMAALVVTLAGALLTAESWIAWVVVVLGVASVTASALAVLFGHDRAHTSGPSAVAGRDARARLQ